MLTTLFVHETNNIVMILNLWQSTSFVPSSNDRDYCKKNDREIFIM